MAHHGTITTDRPDETWGTDPASVLTDEGKATVFIAVDHGTQECIGIYAAIKGTRSEALESLRQGVKDHFGIYSHEVAPGLTLRHDNGSRYCSDYFQNELRFLGIASSPAYAREPEAHIVLEPFIRTRKQQLLWVRRFATVLELLDALHSFQAAYDRTW